MPKETILILEKEHNIQWTLKALLESENYLPLVASTTEKALNHFSEYEVAGLITEYWIDDFCTLEVIRDLKKRFPEVYVMMLTSKELKEDKYKEIIHAGVDDYFQKPFSAEKILLHLKKGLKQREILVKKNQLEQEMSQMKRKGISWGFYRRWKRGLPLPSHL